MKAKTRKEEIAIIMKFQKKTGLNKVTVKQIGNKHQVLMNGKKVFSKPTTPATTLKHIKMLQKDAVHHDKTGVKLNQ